MTSSNEDSQTPETPDQPALSPADLLKRLPEDYRPTETVVSVRGSGPMPRQR